jgi:methionyl-tRNA synthetase
MDKQASFYLTTPIYYVNSKPHLGHAFTSTVADSVARFHRVLGENSLVVTGSDEHGDKIAQAAQKLGQSPQELADRVSAEFRALLPVLGVENFRFIRTSSNEHKAKVQQFLQTVYDKGDIYFGEYGGHYCTGCERFYTEKELENGLCPQHLTAPEFISEKNYFFRMSKYAAWLKQYILDHPDFIQPVRYRSEALALLESGELEDLCISRPKSRLQWGIELPFDHDFVCYVWFDALLSYISALDWPDGADFKRYWPNGQHLIAKDILKPHAIFWPTMLKSAGVEIYQRLNVHGYWLVRDTKMSKSLGNVVDPLQIISTYGLDVFRYFVLREMHFGNDASFTIEALILRQNADLSNDLGNLFSRVLVMADKYFQGVVPAPVTYRTEEKYIQELAKTSQQNFQTLFASFRFAEALESLWEFIRALNKYVDSSAPWTLFKHQKFDELATVIYTLLESLRKIAMNLWPIMPGSAEKMLEQLGLVAADVIKYGVSREIDSFGTLKPGLYLAKSSNLFPRFEIQKQGEQSETPGATPISGACTFDDFKKLDLRVGTILEAKKHPDADKLLCFKVDLGEDNPRSIVSGIAKFFEPEALVGKQVVVVANLPARKIRQVESNGMILTVEDSTGLCLVSSSVEKKPGSKIS